MSAFFGSLLTSMLPASLWTASTLNKLLQGVVVHVSGVRVNDLDELQRLLTEASQGQQPLRVDIIDNDNAELKDDVSRDQQLEALNRFKALVAIHVGELDAVAARIHDMETLEACTVQHMISERTWVTQHDYSVRVDELFKALFAIAKTVILHGADQLLNALEGVANQVKSQLKQSTDGSFIAQQRSSGEALAFENAEVSVVSGGQVLVWVVKIKVLDEKNTVRVGIFKKATSIAKMAVLGCSAVLNLPHFEDPLAFKRITDGYSHFLEEPPGTPQARHDRLMRLAHTLQQQLPQRQLPSPVASTGPNSPASSASSGPAPPPVGR